MTDIRTLLHEAAPAPRSALDMAAVRARSGQRPWRRIVAWIGGLSLVIGAGVATGGGNPLVTTGSDARDREAREATHTDDTSTTVAGSAPGADPSGPAGGGSRVAPAGARSRNDGYGSTADETTSTTAVQAAEYPAAESCSVDNVGLGAGEVRTCSFRATAEGGAEMRSSGPNPSPGVSGEGTVTVTRDGERRTYTIGKWRAETGMGVVFLGCGPFIEPGDLVDVELVNGTDPDGEAFVTTLAAGKGFRSC